MSNKVADLLKILKKAKNPEDFFHGETLAEVESVYKAMARTLHPDRNGQSKDSHDAMARLNDLWDKAQLKFQQGIWGEEDSGVSIQATKLYKNVAALAAGDICDVYLAEQDNGPRVVIKVGYPKDADLVQNEARILKKLWEPKTKAAVYTQQFLPKLIEQTKVKVDGKERIANILEACELGYTLEQVRERFQDGMDPRHVAWIWKRLVEGLTWVHQQGVVHGAITPGHVIIYPKNHGACILDWSYACTDGQAVKAVVNKYRDMYPSEVFEKKPAKPTLDIYMIAQCAKYLLADKKGVIPSHTPSIFKAMIRACSLTPSHRISSLGDFHEILTENLRKVYGPRKFVELNM